MVANRRSVKKPVAGRRSPEKTQFVHFYASHVEEADQRQKIGSFADPMAAAS
jgi:hypothetical protein